MRRVKNWLIVIAITATLLTIVSFSFKINTNYYCCESPTFRWKFAIYCGECDAETGCHFIKLENTGFMEYLGLREINCELNK